MSINAQSVFETALRHHEAGETKRAAAGYRMVLQLKSDFAPAYHYLGLLTFQDGDAEHAIALIRRAVTIEPRLTEAHYNLGNIFRELNRWDEARDCYRAALRGDPRNPAALHNLGMLLLEQGKIDEAEKALRQLNLLLPDNAEACAALGALLLRTQRPREALIQFEAARRLAPRDPQLLYNLGVALFESGEILQAEMAFKASLQLDPGNKETTSGLAGAMLAQRRYRDALPILESLAQQSPEHAGNLSNLAIALHGVGKLIMAEKAYHQALAVEPDNAMIHANLGTTLRDRGRIDEALAAYRHALKLDPGLTFARSNLLFALSFKEDADLRQVLAEHRRFDALYAQPLTQAAAPHDNSREPERRLRVGYLSPDFRKHPCGFFLLPVIENHNPDRIESVCYSTGTANDAFTQRFRAKASVWRAAAALDDAALAEAIRHDRIDILVECTGHMADHRLLAVARKPAPIVVSFPMYPNTTGLSAVDYRFADPHIAPRSVEALYTETLIRLPETHLCYEPYDRQIAVAETTPWKRNGHITFGCFNNISKIGARTVALWAHLLRAVPSARLMLKWLGLNEEADHPLLAAFAARGIGPDRLKLCGWVENHYEPYRDVDICLDALRAAGGTTTCDALWMGVPVVSIYDDKPLSRLGLSLLTNLGLPGLVATSEADYVRIATALASEPKKLDVVRHGLRERLMDSPLMDGPRYTRFIEQAYRKMWQDWCRSHSAREQA